MPPEELLNDAFKTKEFEVKVESDLTISYDGSKWQLPRGPRISSTLRGTKEVDNPFTALAIVGKKVKVVWPMAAAWFVAIAGGNEFELNKIEAVADAAGEYKSVAESAQEQNRKHFKAKAVELKKATIAAIAKGEPAPIHTPGFDVPFEVASEARPVMMPRKQVSASLAEWANAGAVVSASANGLLLTYWSAASLFQDEELLSKPLSSADQVWLKSVFGGREKVEETELRALLAGRVGQPGQVVAMRTA
jgi:hypothetical protein